MKKRLLNCCIIFLLAAALLYLGGTQKNINPEGRNASNSVNRSNPADDLIYWENPYQTTIPDNGTISIIGFDDTILSDNMYIVFKNCTSGEEIIKEYYPGVSLKIEAGGIYSVSALIDKDEKKEIMNISEYVVVTSEHSVSDCLTN